MVAGIHPLPIIDEDALHHLTRFYYDPAGNLDYQVDANGQTTRYLPGLAQYGSGGAEQFLSDRLSSVRLLVSPTGEPR